MKNKVKALAESTGCQLPKYVPLEKIQEMANIRTMFSKEKQTELEDSIRRTGVLQPLLCTDGGKKGNYRLVAGYRRLKAARAVGLKEVAIVVEPGLTNDQIVDYQLTENMVREDLNPVDEGRFLSEYRKKKPETTFEELAQRIGKTPKYVVQRIALVEQLIPAFQEMVQKGDLSLSKAHLLASISRNDQEQFSPKAKGIESWQRSRRTEDLIYGATVKLETSISQELRIVKDRPWKKIIVLVKGGKSLADCGKCMKRSDREEYLLDVVDSKKALCLDSGCWNEHLLTLLEGNLEPKRKAGYRILTIAEAEKKVGCTTRSPSIKFRGFGAIGETIDVPWDLTNSGKYKAQCTSCEKRVFFIRKRRGNYEIARACSDFDCLNEKVSRKTKKLSAAEKKGNADRATAYSDQVVEGSARVFAAAAWALARAQSIRTEGPDVKALRVILQALVRRIGGMDLITNKGQGWILSKCGCAIREERQFSTTVDFDLAPMDVLKEIPPQQLDEAIRAISYFMVMGCGIGRPPISSNCLAATASNLFEVTGDMGALNAQARKLFSPSDEPFLESMVKCGIQAVGRFHGVKGMGGKRKDVAKKIVAAELTSKEKMHPVLEKMFDKGLWEKLSAKPKPKKKKKK